MAAPSAMSKPAFKLPSPETGTTYWILVEAEPLAGAAPYAGAVLFMDGDDMFDAAVDAYRKSRKAKRLPPLLIVGVGFKPGADDLAASPAIPLLERLVDRRARLAYLDDFAVDIPLRAGTIERMAPEDFDSRRFDAVVIVAGARSVALESLCQASALVLDAGGARIMDGDAGRLLRL